MTSTFHPQLFRGSGVSSTSSSSSSSAAPPSPPSHRSSTAASTSTSAVRHAPAPPATSATANTPLPTLSSKSSTSTPNININNNEYIHGLQVNPLDYPAHPSFISSSSRHASSNTNNNSDEAEEAEPDNDDDHCRVRLITAAQYANLVYNHSNIKIQSENVLFPWLHGADIPYSAQAENFGLRDGQYQCVPRYRGLFTIAAHAPRSNDVVEEEEAHESSSNNVSLHSSHRHAASSSGSSSCDSVFLDPTCREESMLSGSPAPMAVEDEEDVTLSASSSSSAWFGAHSPSHAHSNSQDAAQATTPSNPHVRNPTSASIATSYSTDSFCSSTHASTSSSSSSSSSSYSASSYFISRTSSSAASSLLNSGLASSASCIHSASFPLCGDDGFNSRKDTRESSQRRQGSIVEEDGDVVGCESRGHGHGHGSEEDGMMDASRGATSTCLARGDCSEKNPSNNTNDNTVNNGKNATLSMVQPDNNKKKIPFGPEEYASLLVNSHHPHEVLAYEACAELDRIQRRKEEKRRAAAMHSSSNNNNKNNAANQGSQISQYDENVVEDEDEDDSRFVCFQSHPIPTNTVSFRHFRLQRYKYLTISDIVVYHPKGGLHFDAVDIARKVDVAQRKMERVRWERGERHAVRYHVYVALEPFHVFEERFPHLVAVDSRAWPTSNKISFSDKEHEESQALTKASEIGENVFLGNSFDVPNAQNEEEINALHSDVSSNFSFALRRSPSLSSISSSTPSILNTPDFYAPTQDSQHGNFKSDSNPDQYAICIEARDMAAMCSTRNLRERERYLDELQMQIEREREIEAARNTRCGAKSIPASFAHVTSTNQQKKQKSKSNSGARKRSSAFWFSSGSSSEEEEEEAYESTSESSDDGDAYQVKETEIMNDEDNSDFEDFAGEEKELELLYDAPYGAGHGQGVDADITLSPGRFSMALDNEMPPSSSASRASLAQASGRCVSPPPYGFNGASASASSHSTPIKLQYKKSKSLNKARELEVAKAKAEAEAKARSQALAVAERDLSKPWEILKVSSEEVVYMESLSTAQSNQASMLAMVDAIVEYVVWLRTQARPHLRTSRDLQRACAANYQHQQAKYPHQQPYGSASSAGRYLPQAQLGTAEKPFVPMARRVLIHCLDGYTDSSILALSYIMYDRAISLPQAYLYLQNECKRSFFVYSSDVAFLQAIEKRIQLVVQSQGRDKFNDDLSEEEQQARLEAERVARDAEIAASIAASMAAVSPQAAGSSKGLASATRERAKSLIPRPGLFSRSSSKDSTGSCATVKASQVSFSTPATPAPSSLPRGPPPAPRPASAAPAMSLSPAAALQQKEDTNAVSDAWFHSEHFDGHFPSRILDYLYLGNLSHASNALMLKELGITHVLSIGESALVPPSKQCAPSSPSSAARARTPTNSLWLEHSLGNITVMDVQDINDDGVDSILPHLMAGMQFIDSARAVGGKCLVHCRVGVSRSATVVIGQIMKDMDMPLAEAYLLVRARRLNILIQPTILFMHTLWTWEEQIRNLNKKQLKSFEENENHPAFEKSGRICWPVLATEIADLNFKYLNC